MTRSARRILRMTALTACAGVLAGCSLFPHPVPRDSSGKVTARTSANAYDIRLGDCLAGVGNGDLKDVTLLPCEQEHQYEVFAVGSMTEASFPGDDAAAKDAEAYCRPEFKKFTGLDYDRSRLLLQHFHPSQSSWNDRQDRELLCVVADSAKPTLTGTLKDARR